MGSHSLSQRKNYTRNTHLTGALKPWIIPKIQHRPICSSMASLVLHHPVITIAKDPHLIQLYRMKKTCTHGSSLCQVVLVLQNTTESLIWFKFRLLRHHCSQCLLNARIKTQQARGCKLLCCLPLTNTFPYDPLSLLEGWLEIFFASSHVFLCNSDAQINIAQTFSQCVIKFSFVDGWKGLQWRLILVHTQNHRLTYGLSRY